MRPLSILLVGAEDDVQTFLVTLSTLRPFPELHVIGFVSLDGADAPQCDLGAPWLGSVEHLGEILRSLSVDDVILLPPITWKDSFVDHFWDAPQDDAAFRRPRVLVVPSVYDILVDVSRRYGYTTCPWLR
jgi:hypothetical protein